VQVEAELSAVSQETTSLEKEYTTKRRTLGERNEKPLSLSLN
jgi:hypothetical protein